MPRWNNKNCGYQKGHLYYRPEFTEKLRKKMSVSHLGEKSHFWKGGRTLLSKIIRELFEYRQWRSDIFTRDNFTCQKCGQKGYQLEADHYPKKFSEIMEEYQIKTLEQAFSCEELWNINNGRTLCFNCHQKIKSNQMLNNKNAKKNIST